MSGAWRLRAFARAWRLSRWVEQRFTPAGRWTAGGLLGAGLFAIDVRNTLAFQLALLPGLMLGLALLARRRLRPPAAARRELPRLATVGTPLRYRLVLEPRVAAAAGLWLEEELAAPPPTAAEFAAAGPGEGEAGNAFDRVVGYPRWLALLQRSRGAEPPALELPALRPGAAVSLEATLTPLRRGRLQFEAVSLARPDPLGLALARCRLPCPGSLLVLPRLYELPPWTRPGRRSHQPGGLPRLGAVGDSQEFHGIRPYRPGDPLRRLHHPSWARTGTPHVREFQDEYLDREALLLDSCAGAGREACFEDAVSLAASAVLAGAPPDRLREVLMVGERPLRLTAGRGLGETPALIEALACARLSPGTPFARLAELALAEAAQTSAMLLVLLAFDAERRALVERLRAARVQVRVWWVAPEGQHGAERPPDPGVLRLRTGRVREDLFTAAAA